MGEGEPGVVRRCKRCKIIFHIKPDEQEWWEERNLYLPSHCKDCREERRKEKEKEGRGAPHSKPKAAPLQDSEIRITFDSDIFEMHQEAMETLSRTLEKLRSSPVEDLTTFADLDKIFMTAEEVVASSQLLGIIQSDKDAEEEKEETAEEETAESISEGLLESSPQTEAPKAQDEMPSQSQTMEAGAS